MKENRKKTRKNDGKEDGASHSNRLSIIIISPGQEKRNFHFHFHISIIRCGAGADKRGGHLITWPFSLGGPGLFILNVAAFGHSVIQHSLFALNLRRLNFEPQQRKAKQNEANETGNDS